MKMTMQNLNILGRLLKEAGLEAVKYDNRASIDIRDARTKEFKCELSGTELACYEVEGLWDLVCQKILGPTGRASTDAMFYDYRVDPRKYVS